MIKHLAGFILVSCWLAVVLQAQDRNIRVNEVYPDSLLIQNGGRIYNVKSPPAGRPAARGDGKADDTDALISAIDWVAEKAREDGVGARVSEWHGIWPIYIPNGTYLVSRSLHYTGALIPDYAFPKEPSRGGFQNLQIAGQNREHTIIKLKDHAAGFDAGANVPVLSWSRFDLGESFNNWAGKHRLANLTVDTGKGNAGAIGIDYYGANTTRLDNIRIVGDGTIGLHFRIAVLAGYLSNIVIDGFQRGIDYEAPANGNTRPTDATLEYLTLRNQTEAGIFMRSCVTAIVRRLSYEGGAPAFILHHEGNARPQLSVIDSSLTAAAAASGQPAIDLTKGFLFARNVTVRGFGSAVRKNGTTTATGNIGEYVSEPITVFDRDRVRSSGPKSMNLPVEDYPIMPWDADFSHWAVVDDYPGADDTEKMQAAMNSGRPAVAFKKLRYRLGTTITVPATVKQMLGFGCELSGGGFDIMGDAPEVLFIHNFRAVNQPVEHTSTRTVVYDFVRSLNVSANTHGNRKIFFNAGGAMGTNTFKGVTLFARWMNGEQPVDPSFDFGRGTRAWIFGFKSEKTYTRFRARDGALLEVIGGTLNRYSTHPEIDRVCILNDHANISIVAGTIGPAKNWAPMVQDIEGTTKTWNMADFPDRGDGGEIRNIIIPLYVSYDPAAIPSKPSQ